MAADLEDCHGPLAVRSIHLEVVVGWEVLGVFHLPSLLRGFHRAVGCQGALTH